MTHNALEDINVIGQGLKHLFQHWHRRPSVFLHDVQDSGRPWAWNGSRNQNTCADTDGVPNHPKALNRLLKQICMPLKMKRRTNLQSRQSKPETQEGVPKSLGNLPGDGNCYTVQPTKVFIHYWYSFLLHGDGNNLCCCSCWSAGGWGIYRLGTTTGPVMGWSWPPGWQGLHLWKDVDQNWTQRRRLTKLIIWTTPMSNSMKQQAMPCRVAKDWWVIVESSDKMWSTREGNDKPLHYSCLENPMSSH